MSGEALKSAECSPSLLTEIEGLARWTRTQRPGAHAGAVAAIAIPLREAAARRGAENLDADRCGALPVTQTRRRAKRLPRGNVHRDFKAEADVLEGRL